MTYEELEALIASLKARWANPHPRPTGSLINPVGPEAADALKTLVEENKALRAYAREASKELTFHSGGGSEMFKTVAGEPYADPKLCLERILSRQETAQRTIAARQALSQGGSR